MKVLKGEAILAFLALVCTVLLTVQNALAAEARHRRPEKFRCLLRGQSGVGGIYDRWRAVKAKWRGEAFRPQHGKL